MQIGKFISRRTVLTLGNDANAVYEYDLGNRLLKLTNNIDSDTAIVFDYDEYDMVGNRFMFTSRRFDDESGPVLLKGQPYNYIRIASVKIFKAIVYGGVMFSLRSRASMKKWSP